MSKVNNKQITSAGFILQQIGEDGDQDECSMKHIINGLCLIYLGKSPTVQENYIDYSSAGYNELEWGKYEDDNTYEPVSSFNSVLWRDLHNLYKCMDTNTKTKFMSLAHPYGSIEDSHWMSYYLEEL